MLRDKRSVQNYKKYQRAVNKIVRDWNKSLNDDWLWANRFNLSQTFFSFHPYEDKSGAEFYVVLAFKDKKTNKIIKKDFDNYDLEWHLGSWLNKCITEDWEIWNENPDPYAQAKLEGRYPHD